MLERLLAAIIVVGLTHSAFGAGKIQNADVKSLSEVGSVPSRLINDTKLYSTVTGTQLSSALTTLVKQVVPWAVTTVSTGDKQPYLAVPYAHTIQSIYAYAKTAGSSELSLNIYRMTAAEAVGGASVFTTVLSTPLTIDASEHSSLTAATLPVVGSAAGAAYDHYKMEFLSTGGGASDVTIEMVLTTN